MFCVAFGRSRSGGPDYRAAFFIFIPLFLSIYYIVGSVLFCCNLYDIFYFYFYFGQ